MTAVLPEIRSSLLLPNYTGPGVPSYFVVSQGLVGYWAFDADTEIPGVDLSGSGNHGLLAGSPTPTVAFGQIGNALSFNGSTAYVNCGTATTYNFANTTFSVCLWFNNNSATNQTFIANNCLNGGWMVLFLSSGGIEPSLKNLVSNDVAYFDTTRTIWKDGQWHHVTVVFTTSTTVNANNIFVVYVDARLEAGTRTGSANFYAAPSSPIINIGRRGAGTANYTTGLLDDVRIYNRALSGAEIARIYHAGKNNRSRMEFLSEYDLPTLLQPTPTFISAWSRGSNLPVLGTGTF